MIWTDNFDRTSVGPDWGVPSKNVSLFGIVSNQAGVTTAAELRGSFLPAGVVTDGFSELTITALPSGLIDLAVTVRLMDLGDVFHTLQYYFLTLDGIPTGKYLLGKNVGGNAFQLGSNFGAAQVGDVMRLTAIGNVIQASINGVVAATVTDNDLSSGFIGLWFGPGALSPPFALADNWQGGSLNQAMVSCVATDDQWLGGDEY